MRDYSIDSQENGSNMAGKKRFMVFAVCLCLISLGVLIRYGYLMLVPRQQNPLSQRGGMPAGRGPILDRNGRPLALETRLGNISLWLPDIVDPQELSSMLSIYLDMNSDEILSRIENSQSNFLYLRRQVNENTVRSIEREISEGRLRGTGIEYVAGRIYPERNLASQIVGYVGIDGNGLGGIENALDSELRPGRDGGNRVYLTLDVNVQYILENIAHRVMLENRAEAVILMAMDPRTGDILGSVSLPGYDPNNLATSDEISRMDRPAIWAYEPGSVFKVFSLAALLDSGLISGDTLFYCNGVYERVNPSGWRDEIRCLGSHGWVTARDIIIHSCNAGAAYASDLMDTWYFYEYLKDMGFGARTGAGNPGETAGYLRSPDRWTSRSQPTISMGQEIAVSALQMLQAASAIANDGIMVSPRIVSHIVSPDGMNIRYMENAASRRIFSPQTAREMRDYMVDVTSSTGTAWRASMEDLSLAVKTGTSQMIDPATGRYSDRDFIASVIALLPAENPSLILYLAIVKPQGEILAGRIAAPPIREAAEELINYLGIPRGRNPQFVHSGYVSIPFIPYPAVSETVPDFTGIAKRLLQPLLTRGDLNFIIHGDGWVVRQSPPPGTFLDEDTIIILELDY